MGPMRDFGSFAAVMDAAGVTAELSMWSCLDD